MLYGFDCAAVLVTQLLHIHELVHGTVDPALLALHTSSSRLMMLISAGAGLHVQEGTLIWDGQHLPSLLVPKN